MSGSRTKLTLIFSITAALGLYTQCAAAPEFSEDEWYAQIQAADIALLYAPHVNPNGTFFNPWMERSRSRQRSWLGSRIFDKKKKYDFPAEQYAHKQNDYAYLADSGFDSISFAGHASVIIKMDSETIFTDPFFSNSALVVAKKVKIKFDFSKVPLRPVVLISHNHYDHLDRYSVKELIKKEAVFIVPLGLKQFCTDLGAEEVYELDWWESIRLGGITYTLLPAQHWSRRIGQANNTTLWGSFLIQGSRTVYFSGDTGYFRGFEEFGRRYAIDYALLGAGAYDPRWFMHYSHMNVAEFFMAARDLGAKTVIPMHFGVISLSDEPILYPLYEIDEFIKQRPEYAGQVRPLRVGELLRLE
jgi:L-ascorbate metabolism protein UlaG (beta-lactamase superfamily)